MSEHVVHRKAIPADASTEEVIDAISQLDRLRDVADIDHRRPELSEQVAAITDRTAERTGMPISLVTLVLDSSQFVVGSSGLEGWILASGGTPIEWSFCARSVASQAPYVVSDASVDPVQHDNPLVAIDGIRSYAGVPLRSRTGHLVGVHCVIGAEPHDFTESDLEELRTAGEEIADLLDSFRVSNRRAA